MTSATVSGVPTVERYWRELETRSGAEHLHVALLGLRNFETTALHSRLEKGLSYHCLEQLRRVLDVPVARIAELLGIPLRTLSRRRHAGRLRPDESDRLVRLSRLVAHALRLFEGDLGETRTWLATSLDVLANRSPLEFARTEIGSREVENLLGRLEHGIPL